MNMYNDCAQCQTSGGALCLITDTGGEIGDRYEKGLVYLACPKCGRITLPENWNEHNGVASATAPEEENNHETDNPTPETAPERQPALPVNHQAQEAP